MYELFNGAGHNKLQTMLITDKRPFPS